jgi:hypothetical protein
MDVVSNWENVCELTFRADAGAGNDLEADPIEGKNDCINSNLQCVNSGRDESLNNPPES